MTSLDTARIIAQWALDKQAEDIVILDLRDLTTLADYFVIATASVDVHAKAIVNNVERSLLQLDEPRKPLHVEGRTHMNWVLLDLGDVVLHVFQPEARSYYQLERLWGDAPTERVSDEVEGTA